MPGPRALQPAGLPTYLERTCPCSVAITELVLPGNGTDSPYGRKQMWRVTQSYEWVYPKREQLVYSYFPAFLHQWASAVFRGTVCCLGSTNRNPRALGRLMRALQWQDTCTLEVLHGLSLVPTHPDNTDDHGLRRSGPDPEGWAIHPHRNWNQSLKPKPHFLRVI